MTGAPLQAGMMVTAGVPPRKTMTLTNPLGSALKLVGGDIYCLLCTSHNRMLPSVLSKVYCPSLLCTHPQLCACVYTLPSVYVSCLTVMCFLDACSAFYWLCLF